MSQMVKILHIVGDSKYGGGSKVILQLAQMAQQQGWEVDVLTTDAIFQEKLKENGIGVVSLDCIWRPIRPLKDIFGLFRLYQFLRSSNYTLVHTHTSKAGFIGRAAAWYAKIPVVIHTVHGFAFHEESSPLALKVYSTLEKIAAHWCHCLVTVSHFHRDWALRLGIGKAEKIVAIPNGIAEEDVESKRPREKVRNELGIGISEKMILTMGRLAPQKGIEYLLDAVNDIKDKDEGSSFVTCIVGEGPLKRSLEAKADNLGILNKHVRFLGFRGDIGNLLSSSDVVVLPSLWEGLSIALLEAMAAGKAIITTNIGSNVEVLHGRGAGILVPSKDSESLKKAIELLFKEDSKRASCGRKAKEVFLSSYIIDKTKQKYLDLYKHYLNINDQCK